MPDKNFVALTKCFFCGEDNEILLHRRLGDMSEYNGKVVNMDPCPKCAEYMKQGVILITIDHSKSDPNWTKQPIPNPYRTGGFFVIKDDSIKAIISDDFICNWALKHRWMFIEHEAAVTVGLFPVTSK